MALHKFEGMIQGSMMDMCRTFQRATKSTKKWEEYVPMWPGEWEIIVSYNTWKPYPMVNRSIKGLI